MKYFTALLLMLLAGQACAASYRTANFIVEAPTAAFAKQVGDEAERCREVWAIAWLGQKLPGKWKEPCPITLQVGPTLGAGGHTNFVFVNGEVVGWEMSIQGSEQRILDSVLPHEVCHTIFASHFRQPLPRWADEGMCTSIEHRSERDKSRRMLVAFLKEKRSFAFPQMFAMKEYPQDILPLYAEGHSLVQLLVHLRGRRTLIKFVEEGLQTNQWGVAAGRLYGIGSLPELEATWSSWVMAGMPYPQSHVVGYQPGTGLMWSGNPGRFSECTEECQTVTPQQTAAAFNDPYSPRPPDPAPPVATSSPPPPAPEPGPVLDPAPTTKPAAQLVPAPAKTVAVSEPAANVPKVVHLSEAQLFELADKLAEAKKPPAPICEPKPTDCAGQTAKTDQPSRGDADGGSNPATPRASGSSAGWLDRLGSSMTPAVIAGLGMVGISPPVAAIVWYLTRRAGRREVERLKHGTLNAKWLELEAQLQVLRGESAAAAPAAPVSPSPLPPLPQVKVPDSRYVPYEVNSQWSIALDKALDLYVAKYPGGDVSAATIRGLAKQIQTGQIKA